MTFDEILARTIDLLQREGRVSYRALRRRFDLDAEYLEDLKAEIIEAKRLAVDEGGTVLVWVGPDAAATIPGEARGNKATPTGPMAHTPRHLAERILAEQAALEARAAPDGERKTITALFADIKGSMELIEDLDPEEARRIVDPALQIMMDAVHRYEGYVAQSTGDGIFALFGAPIAHEDHPQRALYAALRMQEESERYAERLRLEKGVNVQVRVGINTGEVVVRSIRKDDLHTDYVPVGHSTGLAARMEGLATPGSILVSEHTYKLTEGYFEFKPRGAAQVKGVSDPVQIYEVLGIGPLRTRLQRSARRGLVQFVGRQREMEQMRRALEMTRESHGQIVAVVGEPGVGKSRLCYEFKLLSQRGCLVLETFSVSHGKAYPYLPLIELLKNYFQITLQDDERIRREKVGGKVLMLDRSLEDTLPYLFSLLSVSDPDSPLQQMDPQIRRRRTFEALKRLLVRESLNQPMILIVEDLQWLDNETEAFLIALSEGLATAPLLLLVNYRPEYQHAWGSKMFYTQLRLDPLGEKEAGELLTALIGDGADLQPLKHLILSKTEGTPFFMEEIVQALFDQGVLVREPGGETRLTVPALTEIQIPPTVQGVLAGRIDRLPAEEKALLQTLSVIGREFSLSLLKRVVERHEEELYGLLSHLQEAEFIYEQPAFPEVEYTFKHALTQEVAYTSLLMERRRGLHERTAGAMESLFKDRLEDAYSELAHHYSRGGNTGKAVEYLRLAGQQAMKQSAYADAVNHFTAALDLLQALPESLERAHQELLLQTALGPALGATRGFASPEAGRAYTRARELCQQVGETPQFFEVLRGLGAFYQQQGKLQTAHELREQLLSLAQRQGDPALLLQAHMALGASLYSLGEVTSAQAHLEQGIVLYDPQKHRSLLIGAGVNPQVAIRSWMTQVLWSLGYPDQALNMSREALTLAYERSHPFGLTFALSFAARFHLFRREGPLTRERAEASMSLSTEHGFAQRLAHETLMRGWALAGQEQAEEGIAQMRQGLTDYQATGAGVYRPYFLALLGEAYGKAGQVAEGLAMLEEALALMQESGGRWCEAEIYRVKGELLLKAVPRYAPAGLLGTSGLSTVSPSSEQRERIEGQETEIEAQAEACFLKAISVAQSQQAKSWELRATVSLCRLWQKQGKRAEARQMLTEIYGWFTEGFDTADLKEAKALLEALE